MGSLYEISPFGDQRARKCTTTMEVSHEDDHAAHSRAGQRARYAVYCDELDDQQPGRRPARLTFRRLQWRKSARHDAGGKVPETPRAKSLETMTPRASSGMASPRMMLAWPSATPTTDQKGE